MCGEMYRLLVFCVFCVFFTLKTTDAQTSGPPSIPCASKSNSTCEDCLKNYTCLWCSSTRTCVDYPAKNVLPKPSVCPLADSHWGLCWINFQSLIISTSVLAGVIIIAVLVCCFCCCKSGRIGNKRDDARVEQQDRARKARKDERKTEMKLRHDEIRQKYGLTKGNPYSHMDN